MDADFLVVGGGIGGAVLAELLGRGGRKVLVLEKSAAPPQWVRPEILWPATIEVLFSLSPRDAWEQEAILPLRGLELHDGRRVLTFFSPELLEQLQIQPWSTDPNRTREHLLRLGSFELRRGVEVTEAVKEGSRVVGVRAREVATGQAREFRARWTIGDDGPNSVVRKACQIELKARMFPFDFLCFDLVWPSSLLPDTGRVWLNAQRSSPGILALLAVPLPRGRGAGLVAARPRIFDDLARATESWKRFCVQDAAIQQVIGARQFPQDFVRVRRPWGHAPRYGTEGALLLGDAAHPVSPAGGQGANMSVADACVVADVVGRQATNLLAEYERRRRPANHRSLLFTRVAVAVFGLPAWCATPIGRIALRQALRGSWLRRRFLRAASTAFQERH